MFGKKMIVVAVAVLALAPLARAGHDRYAPAPDLAAIAHDLENATRHVHRTAERLVYADYRSERDALAWLHRLESRARHFHRAVERGHSLRHLERDFFKLLDVYEAAAYNVGHLHSRHVRRDFREVDRLMFRLKARLGFAHPHGRFDHRCDDGHRHGSHGAIVFGDDRGRTRYRVRIGW